ncbi:MAG: DUF615 domain-containing protein [Mailhella sp.]|nr:DUF615 domain-containing protein [Mailhella sp.]
MPRKGSWQIGGESMQEKPSRSQKKRESSALQKTGAKIAGLAPAKRMRIPLTPDMKKACEDYARLQSHEARRRQLQYIGRLMREAQEEGELQSILNALAELE